MVQLTNSKGLQVTTLQFETNEKIYILRMSEKLAYQIMVDDDDFDDDFNLKADIKEDYEEKHSDVDYLSDKENYENN